MTFGYNSTLIDKRTTDRMKDWADELLRQIGYARVSAEERKRPVIFICHSLVKQSISSGKLKLVLMINIGWSSGS